MVFKLWLWVRKNILIFDGVYFPVLILICKLCRAWKLCLQLRIILLKNSLNFCVFEQATEATCDPISFWVSGHLIPIPRIFSFLCLLNIFHVNKQARSDMFKYRGAKVYYFSLNKLPLFLYLWINLSLIQFEKFRSSANILIAYLFYWRFLCSCISESTHVRHFDKLES